MSDVCPIMSHKQVMCMFTRVVCLDTASAMY